MQVVCAAAPIPNIGPGLFYYEATILYQDYEDDAAVGVGLSMSAEPVESYLPGIIKDSFGYHGDNGMIYWDDGNEFPYGPE